MTAPNFKTDVLGIAALSYSSEQNKAVRPNMACSTDHCKQ